MKINTKKNALLVFLVTTALLIPAALSATIIMPSSVEQMAQRSDLIITGRVESVQSRHDVERTNIVTDVIVSTDQVLKGASLITANMVLLTFDGGQVGNERNEMDSMPEFYVGEEVLLFLKSNLDGQSYHVFSIFYGKYRVFSDTDSDRRLVRGPSFLVNTTYDLKTHEPVQKKKRTSKVYLDDFLEEIESYLVND